MLSRHGSAIRVAIVHAGALSRDLLCAALAGSAGLQVVGVYADGSELAAALNVVRPQVAVLDLAPGDHAAIAVTPRLHRLDADLGIVLLLDERDAALLAALPRHGMLRRAYLVNKGQQGLTTLQRAIQVTHARLLDLDDGEVPGAPRAGAEGGLPDISPRQRDILELVARGLTNRAIADMLQIKEKTVENQLGSLYAKLDMGADRSLVHPRVWAAMRLPRQRGDG